MTRKSASGSSTLARRRSASRSSSIAAFGSRPQAMRHAERRRRVDLLVPGDRVAGARHLDRLAARGAAHPRRCRRPCTAGRASASDPWPAPGSAHAGRGRRPVAPRSARRPGRRRRGGHGRAGRAGGRRRTRSRRASRAPMADLEVGRRPGGPPDRERRLGGPFLQSADPRPGWRPVAPPPLGPVVALAPVAQRRAPARAPPARRPRRAASAATSAASIAASRAAAGVVGRRASDGRAAAGDRPRPSASAAWWRVSASGSRSRSTAAPISSCRNPIAPSRLDQEAVLDRPRSRPAVRSASRTPLPRRGPLAERGAGRSVSTSKSAATAASCSRIERSAGRRDEAQDAPALERPDREPAHHQLVERAGERRRRQLTPGGEQLLGHQRDAAGSLGDQEQEAGRRPFAFDPSMSDASSSRSRSGSASRSMGRGAAAMGGERAGPRIVARDDVRLVRAR